MLFCTTLQLYLTLATSSHVNVIKYRWVSSQNPHAMNRTWAVIGRLALRCCKRLTHMHTHIHENMKIFLYPWLQLCFIGTYLHFNHYSTCCTTRRSKFTRSTLRWILWSDPGIRNTTQYFVCVMSWEITNQKVQCTMYILFESFVMILVMTVNGMIKSSSLF